MLEETKVNWDPSSCFILLDSLKENVQKIFNLYSEYKDVQNYTKAVSLEDIKDNEYNLSISLYVEKIIEDNLPSVKETLSNLKIAYNNVSEKEKKSTRKDTPSLCLNLSKSDIIWEMFGSVSGGIEP